MSVIGEPRIFFIGGFNVAHPFRDLPLTTKDCSHYLVQTAGGSQHPFELVASVTEKELPSLKKAEKIPIARIFVCLESDDHGEFLSLEFEPCVADSSNALKFHRQSHNPNTIRVGRRHQITGSSGLQHNDVVHIDDLASFRMDISNVKDASNELENAVVIPSSDGERNEVNGAIQTQQYYTPCVNTDEASARIDETPATSKPSFKDSFPNQTVSSHDDDDSTTEDEMVESNERTLEMAVATKVVNDSDAEIASSVHIESRKRRRSDVDIESPTVKRLKAAESPTPKKPRGRPRKLPLASKDPNLVLKSKRTKSKLTDIEVVEDSTPLNDEPRLSAEKPESTLARSAKKLKVVTGSSLEHRPTTKKFLDRFIVLTDKLDESTDILCILNGELKSTIKIFKALALGIPIVSDKWFSDSAVARELLPFENFLARDPKNEDVWNVSPNWASGNGMTRKDLFGGRMIMITEELKSVYGTSFKQLKEICQLMGAADLLNTTSIKPNKLKNMHRGKVIWLARDGNDKLVKLLKTEDTNVFSKDFLTASIFRGELDMESDQFQL